MTLHQSMRRASARAAFTLLEVLVVVAILIVLAGTAVVYVPRYLEDSKIDRAKMDCQAWEKAVGTFYTKNDSTYPNNLAEAAQFLDGGTEKLRSPWGTEYQLVIEENQDGQEIPIVFCVTTKGQRVTRRGIQ